MMEGWTGLRFERRERGVAVLILDRPEKPNSPDSALFTPLPDKLDALGTS